MLGPITGWRQAQCGALTCVYCWSPVCTAGHLRVLLVGVEGVVQLVSLLWVRSNTRRLEERGVSYRGSLRVCVCCYGHECGWGP